MVECRKIAVMPQPQASIVNMDHCASLVEALPGCYQSESHADVTLYCKGGRSVKAHRLLLGSVSPLLRGLFEEQMCRDMIELSLPDVEFEDLDNLLRYLYEGFIRLEETETRELKALKKLLVVRVPMMIAKIPLNEDQDTDEEIILDCEVIASNSEDNSSSQVNQKRKRSPRDSVNAKKVKINGSDGGQIVQNLNDILQNFGSASTKMQACSAEKKHKERPLTVPLEHFKTFVQRVEEKKALKKIETIVEESVSRLLRKQLTVVKENFQVSKENKCAVDKSFQTEPESFQDDSNSVSNRCSGTFDETSVAEEQSAKKDEMDTDQSVLNDSETFDKDSPINREKNPKTYGKTSKGDKQSALEGGFLLKADPQKAQNIDTNTDHDYVSPSPAVISPAVAPQANKNHHLSLGRSASSLSLSHHVVSLGGSPMKVSTSARSSVAHNKLCSVNVESNSTQLSTSVALHASQKYRNVVPKQCVNIRPPSLALKGNPNLKLNSNQAVQGKSNSLSTTQWPSSYNNVSRQFCSITSVLPNHGSHVPKS